jgi:hypothetical protein
MNAHEATSEYLAQFHGYERLPTHHELATLAASLGSHLPGDELKCREEAKKRIMLAMEIWSLAGRTLIGKSRELARTARHYETSVRPIFGPLRIGNHFLPLVEEWQTEPDGKRRDRVPFPHFLEKTVGLAKEEDRMKWWRAFLAAREHATTKPLQRLRENGLSILRASMYLEDYRRWRLTMKTPGVKADVPYDLEECYKKALAGEKEAA